jgi:hypothetical protein
VLPFFHKLFGQNPVVAIQANVDPVDLPQTTALVSFAQLFGGVLGIGVCGTVFANELTSGLTKYAPGAPFGLVRHSVEAIYTLPVEQQAGVIHAYVLVILTFVLMSQRATITDGVLSPGC